MPKFTTAIYLIITAGIIWILLAEQSTKRPAEHDKIRFLSLAWQTQAIAANKRIVAEWNSQNPDMQVELILGNWSIMQDYLITGFETGDLPDIFHYESSGLVDFALRENLCDLAPYMSEGMKTDIIDIAWDLVTRSNGEVIGIPFMIEPVINIYNKALFEEQGIIAPTFDNPWSWDDFRQAAKKLTLDFDGDGNTDQWGAAMGLRTPSYKMMSLSPGFGGSFFYYEDGKPVFKVTGAERELLGTFKDMLFKDKILTPSSTGNSVMGIIPGFFKEKYAVLLGVGVYVRQQMVENAPAGFSWGVFPNPKAVTQQAGTSGQTLSIPKQCSRPKEAMAFIEYFLNTRNMADLALGDWMVPTRSSCFALPEFQTSENGWKAVIRAIDHSEAIAIKGLPGFREWENRAAKPVFDELFANRLTLDEACERLENESNQVLRRYQNKRTRW